MNITVLRESTSAEHRAVESAMPFMKPDLTREEYVRCLQRLHGIVAAWEETASKQAPPSMRHLLRPRRRGHLLRADLEWFSSASDAENRPRIADLSDEAVFLGALYVMEGSTLGGQLIARHVEETIDLKPGLGDLYFRGHEAQTGPMWREICDLLRTRIPEEQSDRVIESARRMFRAFESWMRSEVCAPHVQSNER